jgi:TonB family protein
MARSVLHETDSIGPCSGHVKPKTIVWPELPEGLRQTIQDPMVLVRVLVDTDGTVMQAEIARPAHPLLDELALEAVRKWEFTPPNGGDKPKRCYITFPVKFRPREK